MGPSSPAAERVAWAPTRSRSTTCQCGTVSGVPSFGYLRRPLVWIRLSQAYPKSCKPRLIKLNPKQKHNLAWLTGKNAHPLSNNGCKSKSWMSSGFFRAISLISNVNLERNTFGNSLLQHKGKRLSLIMGADDFTIELTLQNIIEKD